MQFLEQRKGESLETHRVAFLTQPPGHIVDRGFVAGAAGCAVTAMDVGDRLKRCQVADHGICRDGVAQRNAALDGSGRSVLG
jgi:hypothetical protein